MQEQKELSYFRKKSADVQHTADIDIVLDSGDVLPVHSHYLTTHSSVLCSMIATEASSFKGRKRPREDLQLPLPDTTFEEACDFLTALYSFDGQRSIPIDRLPGILKIAHKFDMREVLNSCDRRMAGAAGFNEKSNVELWEVGTDKGSNQAVEYLIMAENYELHRLAACCERYLTVHLKLQSSPRLMEVSKAAHMRMHKALLLAAERLTVMCKKCNASLRNAIALPGTHECSACRTPGSTHWLTENPVSGKLELPSAAEMMAWARQDAAVGRSGATRSTVSRWLSAARASIEL